MQAYGEKAFKGNIEMVTAIFPATAVVKGDKWTLNTKLEAGMSADLETQYQLADVQESYYLIHGDSKLSTLDKDAYMQTNGMSFRLDLTGTMTSDLKINKKNGWIMEAKITQNLKGETHFKESEQFPEGLKIPMTMTSDMTITEK